MPVMRPAKGRQERQAADPMAELLGAIKAGAYKLRKAPATAPSTGGFPQPNHRHSFLMPYLAPILLA